MFRSTLVSMILFQGLGSLAVAQANVRVNASSMARLPWCAAERAADCVQTEHAAVRDYLQSWKILGEAFDQNRADLLAQDFIGGAMQQLSSTIAEQGTLGIRTHYQDVSHDIQFVFYSPEGSSIEFSDLAKYNVQVFDHGRLISSKLDSTHYLVVMTPSEVRWSIRIFQGGPE